LQAIFLSKSSFGFVWNRRSIGKSINKTVRGRLPTTQASGEFMRAKLALSIFLAAQTAAMAYGQSTPTETQAQTELPQRPVVNATEGTVGSVPAGTLLHIRLRETVSSFGSKADIPVTAIVIQPILLDGKIVIPLGTEIRGQIAKVHRIGLGFSSETALVLITFDGLRVPGGEWHTVSIKVTAVDNSREPVDAAGQIHGIRATASASKVLSGTAISVASLDPMSMLFGLSASLSAFRIPESEIILPVGAELQAQTETAVGVDTVFAEPSPVATGAEDTDKLTELAKSLPYRTATSGKGEPSDITSIMFLGNEEAIIRALNAAGWSRSDVLGAQSTYGVMRSVVENQGYKEGPVSTLLLDRKPPVGAWSKTLDTFFSRHHLRLFAQGMQFDGSTVFVTSATHDSGIGVNKATKTLIHIIDENIDEERAKVVSDMLLTGCVEGVQYIDRPWIPEHLQNATGDTLKTDRRMAVVKMNDCANASRSDAPDPELKKVKEKAIAPERVARDGFLYLRDDLYRGNIIYQGYSAGKMGWGAMHKKKALAGPEPQVVTVAGEPYTVVSRAKVSFFRKPGELEDPGVIRPSFQLPTEKKNYKTKLEYSISGGYSRFANRIFSEQPLCDCYVGPPIPGFSPSVSATYVQALLSGYNIAPRATINSWKYVSNEFGYTYNDAPLTVTSYYDADADTPPGLLYDDGQVRQFSYNALFHARPNGARFRPYAAVGPVFQLLRLTDSHPTKNKLLSITVKDAGIILDAYNFGHTPPLEGGGIFQFGLQYGAGYEYHVTPRFFIRSDFRETISPQPDYWSKSYPTINALNTDTTVLKFIIGKQTFGGALRQRTFTTGIGISF
jgi:opacity protein-like surface antigen